MAQTIEEILASLQEVLKKFDEDNDRRQVFLRAYCLTEQIIGDALNSGKFRHPEWIIAFESQLAQEYLDAVEQYDRGDEELAACWRLAFDYAAQNHSDIATDLLLGINAHVVYDIPVALCKVGIENDDGMIYRFDYDTIDDLVSSTAEFVLNEIRRHYQPDNPGPEKRKASTNLASEEKFDEHVRLLREIAWRDCEMLLWAKKIWIDSIVRKSIARRAEKMARGLMGE